jgi:hypothetical protein
MKLLVIVAFIAILGSLGAALFFMMRRPSDGDGTPKARHMARALALRVGFSVLLFLIVLFSHQMGWIQPTGLPTTR